MAKYGRAAAEEDHQRVLRFQDAILTAAKKHGVPAEVLAGILSRETRGMQQFFIGDHGHGHGPMQIDDRSFPGICAAYRAKQKSDAEMIHFGAEVLRQKIMYLRLVPQLANDHDMLERAGIAAYNCGEGNVKRCVKLGADLDKLTTGQNYSADVLERAAFFAEHGFKG